MCTLVRPASDALERVVERGAPRTGTADEAEPAGGDGRVAGLLEHLDQIGDRRRVFDGDRPRLRAAPAAVRGRTTHHSPLHFKRVAHLLLLALLF